MTSKELLDKLRKLDEQRRTITEAEERRIQQAYKRELEIDELMRHD